MRLRHLASFFLLVSGGTLGSRAAHAFGRQWHLGAGAGVDFPSSQYDVAPAFNAYAAYGLSDLFDVKLELLGSRLSYASNASVRETNWMSSAALGLAYKIDILEWVPYVGLLVGYYYTSGTLPKDAGQQSLALSPTFGLDYAFSRDLALGLNGRYHYMLAGGNDPGHFTLLLRVEKTWGW